MKTALAFPVALLALLSLSLAQSPTPADRLTDRPWMNKSLSPDQRADLVIARMTLDEKLSLVHGVGGMGPNTPTPARSRGGAGFVPGIERLGIPDLQMADAAVGIARGARFSRYSTPLPSNLAEAATWDLNLAREYGSLIGRELRDQGFNVSLGGGVNITREPRNGRNFEYKGEDPILAGKLVGQEMVGLQAQGVIGDIKHFALNDQETGRNAGSTNIDKRSMRESDLLAFEIGLRDSGAGAVMCSYNRVNGDYACENDYLLNQVLKKDWKFPGFVISDWGGTHSTAKAVLNGLDLEMPSGQYFGESLREAIQRGDVPTARLDDMVRRVLRSEFAVGLFDPQPPTQVVDVVAGLELAQRVAEEGTVLLKNDNGQLPLDAAALRRIVLVGAHADIAVLSGGGSAQVDPPGGNAVPPPPGAATGRGLDRPPVWFRSSPMKAIQAKAPRAKVEFSSGTDFAQAADMAKGADIAIVFATQHLREERDAPSLSLPDHQDDLIRAVAAANRHTIVLLETGGPVTMPWVDSVSAVAEVWYPGIRGAEAIANILFGDVNPSGKLPVTFAASESDLPHPVIAAPPQLTGEPGEFSGGKIRPSFDINYSEGLKVGYKWFDAENKKPLFAFGEGLSYTTFTYSSLKADSGAVRFRVTNTGKRAGQETVQVYAALPLAAKEPPRRLVAWEKVQLAPGETKGVDLKLDPLHLSVFDAASDQWKLLPGEYEVMVGGSSRNTPLTARFSISSASDSH